PQEELDFYLSYAKKGQKILEPMCGSGRFFAPFAERGYDISGVDLSGEMLERLKRKVPGAKAVQADLTEYDPGEKFDYIFIPSGSISLLTDLSVCKKVLGRLRELLADGGKLVFAVETAGCRCPDDADYRLSASVKTKEGFDLLLKTKNFYEERSQTQFSPGIYELYRDGELLQREHMDFQTHLYRFGEMETYLQELGFSSVVTYASFQKEIAADDRCETFLLVCGVS
ncbi:MAG: class I SAM-dependent methyltransferase, partial [Oscillospiraceae bacterium]|nr:class I SAM-dependent methyltransferase [Oscillospiraceae bacterium]